MVILIVKVMVYIIISTSVAIDNKVYNSISNSNLYAEVIVIAIVIDL